MPELPEVEGYRLLAERACGRRIASVESRDAWYLKRGLDSRTLARTLKGREIELARRLGKVLLLDLSGGPVLGLRFGMTGMLVVDGRAGVEQLLFSPARRERSWERLTVGFDDGGSLVVHDPRRLGGVSLDPDLSGLGPDAASISLGQLEAALRGSSAPVKARLLDQSRVAGIGNLIVDEVLWRASLAPWRPGRSLGKAELRRLHRNLVRTIADLIDRGGSHRGGLMEERRSGGRCPRDGAELERGTVGGRTTWWCPVHQT